MIQLKKVSAAVLAGVSLLSIPGVSHGLGFGRPTSRTVLGERLQLQVPVRLEAGDDVAPSCVAGDVYLGDDKLGSSSVQIAIDHPTGSNEAVLRLATTVAVNEPVVTVYLVAGCQSKVTRKFVLLVDPPGTMLPQAAAITGQPIDLVSKTGKPVDQAEHPRVAKQAAPAKQKKVAAAPALIAGSSDGSTSPKAASGLSASIASAQGSVGSHPVHEAARQDSGVGRLVLDPVEVDATIVPSLKLAEVIQTAPVDDSPAGKARRAAAAALWHALNADPEQLARDGQRLKDLEQRLVALKAETERARLEAEAAAGLAQKMPDWGLWALIAAVIGLLGAVVVLARRLRQQEGGRLSSDWAASEKVAHPIDDPWGGEEPPEPLDEPKLSASEPFVGSTQLQSKLEASSEPQTVPAPVSPPQAVSSVYVSPIVTAPTPLASSHVAVPGFAIHHEPLREVSVEELIDLEQQAEFFVVLGQDEAAVDLLEGHVQSTTGASPLPYLKLLEIYQRLGLRADYERVQQQFNGRFNGYAPAWESDLQHGSTLEDYPGVVDRLQLIWATPSVAMEVLEKSLTRPDADSETFALPAYRELLFLYAVARDLAERESQERKSVDLLLPEVEAGRALQATGADGEEDPSSDVSPLMATRPVKPQAGAKPHLSLDLQLDDLPDAGVTVPGLLVDEQAPPPVESPTAVPKELAPLDFDLDDLQPKKPSN